MGDELVKMSEKGQLVVPKSIRKKEGFKNSDRFIAIGVKEGVLFKKIDIPKVRIEFESLSKEIRAHLKRQNGRRGDVVGAIEWAGEG